MIIGITKPFIAVLLVRKWSTNNFFFHILIMIIYVLVRHSTYISTQMGTLKYNCYYE